MPQPQDVTPNGVQACVALYDNYAETPDELSFKSGDILTVIQQDSPGLEGWWICALRGKQGICPSNRVRALTDGELSLLGERRRRSWNTPPSKVSVGQKMGESMVYDMPQSHDALQLQYDVPLTAHPSAGPTEERYDVPKPVTTGSLTPSSSISSLTTDSNRSSLIQQDYDVPRSVRLQPTQEEEVGSVSYDVPRSGAEVPLDLDSALDLLGRLESQITCATSRLLACAGPNWRLPQKLEPRLAELRAAVSSLTTSLHQLTIFIHPILLSQQDKGLGGKLSVLFDNLAKNDVNVRECWSELEYIGWTITKLGVDDEGSHQTDALDRIVSAAAILTDDIRQIASFIQGNSTLLFKKKTSTGGGWSEDLSYMNIDKKEVDEERERRSSPQPPPPRPDPRDYKILDLYSGQLWTNCEYLSSAIETFLLTVTENQPPKNFVSHAKPVISFAHKLVAIGDAVERSVGEMRLKNEVANATNSIADATSNVVQKTKCASVNFPNVQAVQFMVDAVVDLSQKSKVLRQAVLVH